MRMLEPESVFFTLTRSLGPIGSAIYKHVKLIEDVGSRGNQGYLKDIADDETEIIENLLGTAFVVCQIHITCVVSRLLKLHTFFRKNEGRLLTGLEKPSKVAIMKQGGQLIAGSQYTDVMVIDGFANYFKHREEWDPHWAALSDGQAKTRDVIKAFGATPGSSGNLRIGAETLGNSEYSDVICFVDKLESWRTNLKNTYDKELKAQGVI